MVNYSNCLLKFWCSLFVIDCHQHQYLKLNQIHPIYSYQNHLMSLSFIVCFNNSIADLIINLDRQEEGRVRSKGSSSLVHSSLIGMLLLFFFANLSLFSIDFLKNLKWFRPLIDLYYFVANEMLHLFLFWKFHCYCLYCF